MTHDVLEKAKIGHRKVWLHLLMEEHIQMYETLKKINLHLLLD